MLFIHGINNKLIQRQLKPLPVVKENLLVMICCFNEAKVVLQCGNKSMQSLGIGGIAVEDPDGDCTLLASSLHFIDGELHLRTHTNV